MNRRTFLLTAAALPFALAAIAKGAGGKWPSPAHARFAELEKALGGRLGVYGEDTENGVLVGHRANERFPMCSTFKLILVAAILARSTRTEDLLHHRIRYQHSDLVHYSPVTTKHVSDGMTVAELCAAAIQYSDNTSANLLMKVLGGPAAVTAYAHSIGNRQFRLDRWEPVLNTCIPGDTRDTATPASMAHSLQSLTVGNALPASQRQQLDKWLQGNTTGNNRVGAVMPHDWKIGDKTGSGDYGTVNDLAVLYPPGRKPVIIAIYYTQERQNGGWRDSAISAAARIVLDNLGFPEKHSAT